MLSDLFHFLSHVQKQIHRTTRRRNLGSPGCYNIVLRSKVKIGDKQRKPRLSRNFSDTLYLICQLLMCPQPPADCPCRSIVQEFQQSRRPLSRLETFFCNYVNGTLFFSHFSLKIASSEAAWNKSPKRCGSLWCPLLRRGPGSNDKLILWKFHFFTLPKYEF